ncbi:MAG: helix-turn-helix domain-containing protein [Bacteroidales bacterium]|nr:helix-turn-helix domain-containing protein [Bacteroidales bacterium]
MYQCHCFGSIYWYGPDRDDERERIGAQIRSLREERKMDAKDLASLADLDASNLCRIEMGKYSPGLDILCKIATALNCTLEFVPNSNSIEACHVIDPTCHQTLLITAKRSTFRLAECLEKYGEYHWQQSRYNVSIGDTIYIYVSEDREIKYRMSVEAVNVRYDQWMVKEEAFWVDKDRINQGESEAKYALLRLEATSKSGKLTEENLTKHGFIRAPQGTKELDGELLKYIERRF